MKKLKEPQNIPLEDLEDLVKNSIEELPRDDELTQKELDKYQRLLRMYSDRQDIDERKKYAKFIFIFVLIWTICLFGVIISAGLGILATSDAVILALIASTTVMSLSHAVTKYLFPEKTKYKAD